jgi:hypothetical protein
MCVLYNDASVGKVDRNKAPIEFEASPIKTEPKAPSIAAQKVVEKYEI